MEDIIIIISMDAVTDEFMCLFNWCLISVGMFL